MFLSYLIMWNTNNLPLYATFPNLKSNLSRGGFRTAATSKMECFEMERLKPSTIITKHSILDVPAVLCWAYAYFKQGFPIGNAFNVIIINYGAKNFAPLKTMNEDQIKAMSGYRSHVLPIAFKVTNCLNTTWIHHTRNKQNAHYNKRLPQARKDKAFPLESQSRNAY